MAVACSQPLRNIKAVPGRSSLRRRDRRIRSLRPGSTFPRASARLWAVPGGRVDRRPPTGRSRPRRGGTPPETRGRRRGSGASAHRTSALGGPGGPSSSSSSMRTAIAPTSQSLSEEPSALACPQSRRRLASHSSSFLRHSPSGSIRLHFSPRSTGTLFGCSCLVTRDAGFWIFAATVVSVFGRILGHKRESILLRHALNGLRRLELSSQHLGGESHLLQLLVAVPRELLGWNIRE